MSAPGKDLAVVLVIEDDPQVRRFLRASLGAHDFKVLEAEDGEAGVRMASQYVPDLVLLDLGLPKLDGMEVTRRIRTWSAMPILILSARGEERQKVEALDAGADDYLTKPFALEELLARVRALLRRTTDGSGETLEFADLTLDPGTRDVTRNGERIELTRTEFALLELFMLNPRQVLTRSLIFERVWGYDFGFASNSLDVYIGYLRRKTEAGGRSRLIHTVRGVGYALRET